MPLSHKDRVRQAVTTGGVGSLVLGAASVGYQALVAGDDAKVFPYVIEDGSAWETGYGTYTHSGTVFARTIRIDSSTGAALNVTTSAYLLVGWISQLGESSSTQHETHISGLQVSWVSTSAIDIGIGAAYVESVSKNVRVAATISLTGLSLGNNAWGYVYLKSDGTAECNTTAPASPYAGKARSKTSDNSRRFLGVVRTDGSGNIRKFYHSVDQNIMQYAKTTEAGSFWTRMLSAGPATSPTDVDCSAAIPAGLATKAAVLATNYSTASALLIARNGDLVTSPSFSFQYQVPQSPAATGTSCLIHADVDSSAILEYAHHTTPDAAGAYLDIIGYLFDR